MVFIISTYGEDGISSVKVADRQGGEELNAPYLEKVVKCEMDIERLMSILRINRQQAMKVNANIDNLLRLSAREAACQHRVKRGLFGE